MAELAPNRFGRQAQELSDQLLRDGLAQQYESLMGLLALSQMYEARYGEFAGLGTWISGGLTLLGGLIHDLDWRGVGAAEDAIDGENEEGEGDGP